MKLYQKSAEYLKKQFDGTIPIPFVYVILGSGLGNFDSVLKVHKRIPFADIPGFAATTVKGHSGELCIASFEYEENEIYILVQKGRFHYYEGYEPYQITFPVRTGFLAGIKRMIVTNAAGGINKDFETGDLMLIKDHISLFAPSALRGPNMEELGPRFPDMTSAYDEGALNTGRHTARRIGIEVKEGVYAFTKGPMFETPAEIRALSVLGADAVGMSTVPEVITAVHCGMKTAGISLITNMAAGISGKKLSHEDVNHTAQLAGDKFSLFLKEFIKDLHKEDMNKHGG